MTTNVSPREQKIIEARAVATSRAEFADLINMSESGALKIMKRMGLPLFKKYNPRIPQERVDAVVEAYLNGISYRDMMQTLNLSEGMIAGIINRAGLSGHRARELAVKKGIAVKRAKPKQRNRMVRVPNFRAAPFQERISAAPFLGVTLMDRKPDQCANPDPKCDDPRAMTYCGQPVYGSLPYCLACCQILYRPAEARERAPRPR